MPHPRVSLLGVSVSALNLPGALAELQTWVETRQAHYVCVAPAHSLMACVNQPALLPAFNQAGMVTPDGMGVVWALKLKGQARVGRVYGPDLLLAACQAGLAPGWRHYFYGGAPGVADALAARLQGRFPGLQVTGVCSPPFGRPDEKQQQALNAQINASRADIVWVGMGSPWQETWMHEQRSNLQPPVLAGVGAAFDFLTGRKPQAPAFMQRAGLEWFFRLLSEPRRLWPRYREYPRYAWLVFAELLAERLRRG